MSRALSHIGRAVVIQGGATRRRRPVPRDRLLRARRNVDHTEFVDLWSALEAGLGESGLVTRDETIRRAAT